MAHSNGVHSTAQTTRRKLVQPVLPALPLLPKFKKKVISTTVDEQSIVNGGEHSTATTATITAPAITPAANDSPAKQPLDTSTPELDSKNHVVDTEVSRLDQNLAPNTELEEKLPEVVKTDPAPTISNDNDQAQQDSQEQIEEHGIQQELEYSRNGTHFDTDDQTQVIEQLAKEELGTPCISTPAGENAALQPFSVGLVNEGSRKVSIFDPEAAPEAVTGAIETYLSANHSVRPSISNSSIQQTPNNVPALPVSPPSAIDFQKPDFGKVDPVSITPPAVNGYDSPTGRNDTVNGTSMTSTGHASFPTLLNYITALKFRNDLFDSELCLYSGHSSKPIIYRNAHSIILARSERLSNFIHLQRANSFAYYVINLMPTRTINPNAFDSALDFLYTDILPHATHLIPQSAISGKAGKIGTLDYLLSYMVSGLELGLQPVTTYALDLIGKLLDWESAEWMMKEAISLRAGSSFALNAHTPPDAVYAAESILQNVLNLIILGLEVKCFKLDPAATPGDLPSRFAYFESGRSVNPALANMVFGSMPVSGNLSPTSPTSPVPLAGVSPETIASLIMLNLDFHDLRNLARGMKKVHGEDGMRVIADVVEERERRRVNVLNNRAVSNAKRSDNKSMWDVIGWREFVADGSLYRDNVSFYFPSKRNEKD